MVRSVIPSGPTLQEQLLARSVTGSPFRPDPPPRPNTDIRARCGLCSAQFITVNGKSADEWLSRHVERGHAPREPRDDAAVARQAADIVAAMITSGALQAGETVTQTWIMEAAGITRRHAAAVINVLIHDSVLELSQVRTSHGHRVAVVA